MLKYDVLVIGAGPAGLAAAQELDNEGQRIALLDSGRSVQERDRHHPEDMTCGHGGAGLFSDGKFSFFPSASALWRLPDREALRRAYDWTSEILTPLGLDVPPFPESPDQYSAGKGEWVLKEYPSSYLDLPTRLALTDKLVSTLGCDVLTQTHVESAAYDGERQAHVVRCSRPGGDPFDLEAKRLLVATGRFGPLHLSGLVRSWTFKRLEAGVRIRQPADRAFFADLGQLDPKLRFLTPEQTTEWRTFCACRRGEAVLTRTQGLWTVSGRADGPPTSESNIGFNTRVEVPEIARDGLQRLLRAASSSDGAFTLPLADVLARTSTAEQLMSRTYGEEVYELIRSGLVRISERFPAIRDEETALIGPTLEGVGWYPQVDGDLRSPDAPLWVAGDACGLFRGIVAAMISGYYAARTLKKTRPRSQGDPA
ncbi:FAD-dependent oxidoreductase [Allosalinactinospora lopnorensis]|uniref:FAD-dependent oxidoreductase n=1 Tax=Allosalinactinospora lopnorensis TaxID=1352348 RepID=UPI0009E3F930|nr:FAD-dependent oxidoreductase [Allosalinactinospora lopnorensis]